MATDRLEIKTHDDYTVGWICALSKEQTAATAMLDKRHCDLSNPPHDSNAYTLGSIGKHNIVIACLPEGMYGTNTAANVVTLLAGTFPSVRACLMVGIGGGIPSQKVRLGDVVVGRPEGQFPGVVQWDMGKAKQDGEFERTGTLDNPPKALLTALAKLKTENELSGSRIPLYLDALKKTYPKAAEKYLRSDSLVDICFKASYDHVTLVQSGRNSKRDNGYDDEEEDEEDEEEGEEDNCRFCDKSRVVKRKPRDMRVHYGLIASGNQVIKDAKSRDKLNKDLGGNVLCVEMEAAGIVNNFPCLVIRGICDYSDSHKNKAWQEHAAAVAAAYAKELLLIVQPNEVRGDSLIKDILKVQETLSEIALDQKKRYLNKQQQDIFKWLSPLNPSARHIENRKKRTLGTGTWLLEDTKFLDWSSNVAKCRILCCYGDPGAGKTIVSSLLIDNLQNRRPRDSNIGLGYVYCDYRDQEDQTTENILGAVLTQLIELLPEVPKAVLEMYEKCVKQKRSLSAEDATDLLWVSCALFNKVYVCVDALDELRNLRGLLKCLRDGPSSIQIFLTGRPHIQEIVQEYLNEKQSITIEAHECDIRQFIEHEIGGPNDIEPKAMDERLRMQILKRVVNSAKGIFLLPTLQVRAILQATTIRDRKEALKKLPSDLGKAYAGTMTRIQEQPAALAEQARKIIMWVHLAERPLTINELLCSLAIKEGDTYFDPDGVPISDTLLNCCHGLVVADQETSTVRLVHYSLQEHLLSQDELFNLPKVQWHSRIAYTCLTFLKFPPLTAGQDPEETDKSNTTVTLLHYAATQWGHHLRRSEKLTGAFELGKEYLLAKWTNDSLRLLYQNIYGNWPREAQNQIVLPAHIAAFFGLEKIMLHLGLTRPNLDLKDICGQTPLSWAAEKGHEAVVKILIEKGAAIDSVDTTYGRTPLLWAAGKGHEVVVKILIERDATVDSVDKNGRTPLLWAAEKGHEAVVKILVEKVATVDSVDIYGQTPLLWAAKKGYEAVVKVLIEKGAAIDSVDKYDQTPLSWAAKKGYEAVVKVLIEKGAVIDSVDTTYGRTPLSWAAEKGHEAVVKILIEKGAAIDSVDTVYGWTPLLWAVGKGHEAVVKILIERDATVDLVDKNGWTPLLWAAGNGYEAVVKILVEKVATVDSVDEYGQTPLLWAAKKGYEAVVKVLIEKDAVIDSVDTEYGQTPLSWAAEYGHEAVVKILIEKDATVDSIDKYGRTPLSWAVMNGYEAVVKILIEKDATVDSMDKYGQTPLSWAATKGHEAVVKILIEKDTTVDSVDKYGRTPLSWAAEYGHEAVMKILIEKDATVDSVDKYGRTPLLWAAKKGHEAVVKILIEKGATIYSVDAKYGRTPLSWAAKNGHEAVLKVLRSVTP